MDFVVIDVETANADVASICQVGIASFRDGDLVDSWISLVNPEGDFSYFNVSIHGIDEDQVQDAPTWEEIFPQVAARLQDRIVVSHTPFDQRALTRACGRYHLPECSCAWLDSARVVRMAWPRFSRSGYSLPNVAAHFGIDYQAHDALEDARCAGLVLLRAVEETGISPQQWLARVEQPAASHERRARTWPAPCKRSGNPRGPLAGEVLVFTGDLSIARETAADLAAAAGCCVEAGVTRRTTLLVVGGQDGRVLTAHEKSAKHRKAEELIGRGRPIRILGENDFLRIVSRPENEERME